MGQSSSFPRVKLDRERIVIVTGCNQGVGYHTAKWIAMMGATVIMACRSTEKALEAIEKMQTEYKEEKAKGNKDVVDQESLHVEFMKLDNSSFESVVEFAAEFKRSGRKLHVLICNAGIMTNELDVTVDGFDNMLQVNYLSHFLLITHLLPIMLHSGDDCRVINLSSIGHHFGSVMTDDLALEKLRTPKYNGTKVYQCSKLYQIMMMYSMNRFLKNTNVSMTTVHPGTVDTGLLSNFKLFIVPILKFAGFSKTPFEGAWTSINCAVNPELKGVRDVYFADSKPAYVKGTAKDPIKQDMVYSFSKDCISKYINQEYIEIEQQK